jgi:hypothetical protein
LATAAVILAGLALPAGAVAASVTVKPALPSPGGAVTISAQDFKRGASGVAVLPGARSRRFTVDARGRATVRLHLRRSARKGSRILRVRAARTRVSTIMTVVTRSSASSTLVALGGGQRVLANPARVAVGGAFKLQVSGFAPRSMLTARLGGATVVRRRVSARGALVLQATVPAVAPGAHLLRVKAGRALTSLRFVVLATASTPSTPGTAPGSPQAPPTPAAPAADPVIAAAGDIACSPSDPAFNGGIGNGTGCRQQYTSDLLVGAGLSAVLPLGDIQYDCARLTDFAGSFGPSWGRVKPLMRPTPGNHEYQTSDQFDPTACTPGEGYFSYFGAAAGDPSRGYYSFDIGSWHVISLNTNLASLTSCPIVSCAAGSPQEQWLRADLAAHPTTCTLVYWHHPMFSSKTPHTAPRAFWDTLYAAGADVVLNGHVHHYERFAPQRPDGTADPVAGIRQFVVGTGGKSLEAHGVPAANSEVRGNSFGVLQLTLRPSSYLWAFRPVSGPPTDSGQTACH